MSKIKKLLVSNRGEIALRIIRSAKEMGIWTAAIYSEADADAPHVHFADQAYLIGPPPSSESYLKGDKIIDICLEHHIDAIHPGYGFLSENAEFAKAVREAGIIFIGPSSAAIELMGDKLKAKQAVSKFGVPLLPGLDKAITDIEEAKNKANEIGFPVLIKAAAGGGGKGMRIVNESNEFEEQMERAVSEAENAFGNGSVFIEKFITSPRHIEIQILADSHGNTVHLFERECSIQRRHQKVIEEAPSSVLTPQLRAKMGEAAVNVCKACNYINAGTVEFLLDESHGFYFLEMNTRLQVEHPVTELITGIDLVKEQINIAEGGKLAFEQNDLQISGHAIEARVYAEDPANNFLPDIGKLHIYRRPQGDGIRLDDGYREGMDVPIHYDPMIAKLISYADTREGAIEKLKEAIRNYIIIGIQTTLPFCEYVMNHPAFKEGNFDTQFIKNYFDPNDLYSEMEEQEALISGIVAHKVLKEVSEKNKVILTPKINYPNAWRLNRIK